MVESEEKIIEILRILNNQEKAIGAKIIADELKNKGYNLGERAVRYHMQILDEKGFTEKMGYAGRKITNLGKLELEKGLIYDQVDFIFSKFEEMIFQTKFNIKTATGNVIINNSELLLSDNNSSLEPIEIMKKSFSLGLAVSPLVEIKSIKKENEKNKKLSIKTVCGTTIDGILLNNGIPTLPLYGGLIKIEDFTPQQFTELISYKKTSITPLDAFIADKMTSVLDVITSGEGIIPANFRVVPSESISKIKAILKKLNNIGLNGVISIGENGKSTLGIPVSDGLTGITIMGGITPLCAVKELGYGINIKLSDEIANFKKLKPINPNEKYFKSNILKLSNNAKKPKKKVSFILNSAYNLIQNVDFDIETHEGKLIANISYLNSDNLEEAIKIMKNTYIKSKDYISPYYKIIDDNRKNNNQIGIATISSLSIDGILINNGIMSTPKYGGLLERGNKSLFVELISYSGSSLDPHEIFIFKNMTSINQRDNYQRILASLKEVPLISRNQSKEILEKLRDMDFPIYKIGKPREILYNGKVDNYKFGVVAGSGLNQIAAIKEKGINVNLSPTKETINLNEMDRL